MYIVFFKPVLDRLIGALGLIVLSPVLLLMAIVLLFYYNGAPFFIQKRIGKGNRVFLMLKFRTMNSKKCPAGNLLSDEERMTKLGRWIRNCSLDELPQLYNLAKGDMSLIGPRPLLVEYLPLYNAEQAKRHWVKPGITGLAQVNGRNRISWEEKFTWDVHYVQNQSLKLDFVILIRSIMKLWDTSEIYGEEGVVRKFEGNK